MKMEKRKNASSKFLKTILTIAALTGISIRARARE
jgi:hypothetical protein